MIAFILALLAMLPAEAGASSEREVMYRRYLDVAAHVHGGSVEPHWMAEGTSFWYAAGEPDDIALYRVDRDQKTLLLDVARARRSLAMVLGHEPPYKGLPFREVTFDGDAILFTVENKNFRIRLDNYEVTADQQRPVLVPELVRKGFRATALDIMEVPSPDRRWFAGERGFDISLRSAVDGRRELLTSDGIKDYQWDVEGAKWSPDSFKLAVLKSDNRRMALLPIIHWLKPTEEVEWARYTKAGGEMPQVDLYVVDILSKQPVRVDVGSDRSQQVFPIAWRPDGSELLFMRVDREFKRLDVMAADPATGKSRIVMTETQKTFIQALPWNFRNGIEEYKILLTLLDDGKRFIWMSERDGWNHLYLYSIDGTVIRQITTANFPVVQVLAVDAPGGWVYYTAHGDASRPYDTHLYRVRLDGSGFARLTEGTGQHAIRMSPSKQVFVDTHSSVDRPPAVDLRNADGKLLQTLSSARLDPDLHWTAPEEFVAKAADGKTDLYGVMFKPWDFDAAKKYPVIDNIYGGPQITWVPREFLAPTSIWPRALAQLGFVVFVVDARGTPDRGKAFQDVVYGNFGRNEIPDHVVVLQQLARQRPYMDLERVGLFGGSWGGYMTIRGMLLAPDVYRVGVSIYPVADLYDHRAGPIEPYMGVPQNNREGYEYGSSLRLADRLKGPLLLIHGTSDVNATFSATMKMVEALTRAGKRYDLIVLPEQTHRLEGVHREYVLDAVRRYFTQHLRP